MVSAMPQRSTIVVNIGGMPIALSTTNARLVGVLESRFAGFVEPAARPVFQFDVTVAVDVASDDDADLRVTRDPDGWRLQRGDFSAWWNPATREGWIRQCLSPYSIDSVLRIVHTVVLAADGGFLLHASSGIRDGRAVLFTGPSGAGKTTVARLAPGDVTLLTDEISYVRPGADGFSAFGTPFAGELGEGGTATSAPVAALFRLRQAGAHARARLSEAECVRTLMRNILFFDNDPALTAAVFESACHFASRVPAYCLDFTPDAGVWERVA
jgi:hypothetical protein